MPTVQGQRPGTNKHSYLVLLPDRIDEVLHSEHEAQAHMADLFAMRCEPQLVVVDAAFEALAYDSISEALAEGPALDFQIETWKQLFS